MLVANLHFATLHTLFILGIALHMADYVLYDMCGVSNHVRMYLWICIVLE